MTSTAAADDSTPTWWAPLRRRPTRSEVRDFRRSTRIAAPHLRWSPRHVLTSTATIFTIAVLGTLVVGFGLLFAFLALTAILWVPGPPVSVLRLLAVPLLVVDLIGTWFLCRVLMDIARRDARLGLRWRAATVLHRFAEHNDLDYLPLVPSPPPIGMLLAGGTRRVARDLVAGDEGVCFVLGNHQSEDAVNGRTLRRFGFLALELPRALPHMVLVSRTRAGLLGRSLLLRRLRRDQLLRLGAPLDEHFKLYCPLEYASDARYVFTPKMMEVLVAKARSFDIEIVDDRMVLYRRGLLRMTDPATYIMLGDLIRSVRALTAERASLYRDPRSFTAAGSSPPGRRLRPAVPVAGIVIVSVFSVYLVAVIAWRFAGG